jgi:hypothetical protein
LPPAPLELDEVEDAADALDDEGLESVELHAVAALSAGKHATRRARWLAVMRQV